MRISESCEKCLYDRQKNRCQDEEYLAQVSRLLGERGENDSSPLLVYRFNKEYERRFGKIDGYAQVKRRYNDLMRGIEDRLRVRIANSEDSVATALSLAQVGNYIDYGAMDRVDESICMSLLEKAVMRDDERKTYNRLMDICAEAGSFLLIADNCGEIVLDKLFLEQLKIRFPQLSLQVLVRGREVLNDVTPQDAAYVGIDRFARVISNGEAIAGTVYDMLPEEARLALDGSDVILAKGQGNYESLSGQGRHIFYAFLCKCDLFTNRFNVRPLTSMLVEEVC